MHLEGAHLLRAKTVRGLTEISAELRDCMDVRLLRRRRQIADRHVLDHAAAKRADLSHRKPSCLKGWALTPTILSDRRRVLRLPLNCRASGFVQSPESQNFRDPVLGVAGYSVCPSRDGHLITSRSPRPNSAPASP